jgi:hypothetical protein
LKTRIAQILFSAFLIFHVTAIFILPNPESIIFRETEKIFLNYGNFLGINTTWRFFSPNPLIRILEYEVIDSNGNSDNVVHKYPISPKADGSRESYNRQLNYAMYMMSNNDHLRDFLTPFLCRRHPEASSLTYYSVQREMPTVERAAQRSSSRENLEKLTRTNLGEFLCRPPETENDSEVSE